MEIELDIRSHSHKFAEGCFAFFEQNAMGLRVIQTSESTFTLVVEGKPFKELGSEHILYHSHLWATSFLIALNIATLGYLSWKDAPSLHPIYRVLGTDSHQVRDTIALVQQVPITLERDRELTDLDIHNALITLGALTQDNDPNSRVEYLKGLLHIGASHLDVTFYREAFGNFYRCMESFVTRHVLGVRQLSNEVKDIQRALAQIGAGDELQTAFKEIYAIRSNQVAHAQKQQIAFELDDVFKAKAFADLVMYKTYRKHAENWRAENRA